MKKTLIVLGLVAAFNVYADITGYLQLDNFASDGVTIGTGGNPANGPIGAFIGSDYTASLYWANGTITDTNTFLSLATLSLDADTQFYGDTGFAPDHWGGSDGAGLFEVEVALEVATRFVTVQARVWYNGGGLFTSFDQAANAGQNVSWSNLIPASLGVPPLWPPEPIEMNSFVVTVVPEPSTFALAGLGSAGIMLFRRHIQSKRFRMNARPF